MIVDRRLPCCLAILCVIGGIPLTGCSVSNSGNVDTKSEKHVPAASKNGAKPNETEKKIAQNMAVGKIILMASCLGKEGAIPREKIGEYIAAGVKQAGISREELYDNWKSYWKYAKEAEKSERTACLD